MSNLPWGNRIFSVARLLFPSAGVDAPPVTPLPARGGVGGRNFLLPLGETKRQIPVAVSGEAGIEKAKGKAEALPEERFLSVQRDENNC